MQHTKEPHTAEPWSISSAEGNQCMVLADDSTGIAEAYKPEDARRIAACVNACAGISTEQLEAMNAIAPGSLASAYDAASAIVEEVGFATLEDEDALDDVSNDDCFAAVHNAAEYALQACAWARETAD